MLIPFKYFLVKYRNDSLRIVYYHIVSNNNPEYYFPNKALAISEFKKHLDFFKTHFEIINLKTAINYANEGVSLKRKMVITFDDGFKENYEIIAPILSEYGISGTFFFTTNCIDNTDLMWRNKLLLINKYCNQNTISKGINLIVKQYGVPNIKKGQNLLQWSFSVWPMSIKENIINTLTNEVLPFNLKNYLKENSPYCTSKQIIELYNEGFEIGSHSVTHPIFDRLDYDDFFFEIMESNKKLSILVKNPVLAFSYPFGRRAPHDFEKKLSEQVKKKIVFLGTKNSLQNYDYNMASWERDNIEHSYDEMMLRFLYLPLARLIKKTI